MTWFTWRQFRTQTWVTVAALVALGILLVVTGRSLAHAYASTIAACHGDCAATMRQFVLEARNGTNGRAYNLTTGVMYAVPALIGIFWGAPLFARELETGTHYLAWNQSVTRTRWLATKLAVVGGAAAATVGLLSWAVTSWAGRVDSAAGDRIAPLVYGARGVVPIGWAVFAFALGVTLGMLIRRTIPAMVATTVLYVFAVTQIPRQHLVRATHINRPLDMNSTGVMYSDETHWVWADPSNDIVPRDAWVLANRAVTPSGGWFNGPKDPRHCPDMDACTQWVSTLGLRQDLTYHPASHFWPLQMDRDRHLRRRRGAARRVLLLADPPVDALTGIPWPASVERRTAPARRYTHVTAPIRRQLLDGLTALWHDALGLRRGLSPRSPVAVLDRLLTDHAHGVTH